MNEETGGPEEAAARPRRGRRRPWRSLRIRHKLSVSLVIVALLPVVVASWVAGSVILGELNRGLQEETDRQLHVGVNLLLRQVERLGDEAVRLSISPDLREAMREGPVAIADSLAREAAYIPSSLVQVADVDGVIQAQRVVGGVVQRFAGIAVEQESASIQAGRKYERRVTITRVGDQLVVRAAAPIVDRSYSLLGVVVISLPLDGDFADAVKAALGTDVLLFAGTEPGGRASSTFLDKVGARVTGLALSAEAAARVARGRTSFQIMEIAQREYAVGHAPIMNLAGEVVGVLAVAVDRAPLVTARQAATRSLALGAAGAILFALGLAGLLSRRITRPLSRLHQGVIAIARGDLDHRIEVAKGDEIGDLAVAFSHMTSALKENQRRLAARMREIVALHDAGRAVSSVLDLDQVLKKIVDQVARVLHVRVCALWVVDRWVRAGEDDDTRVPRLRLGAARAKRSDMRNILRGEEVAEMVEPLARIAAEVARERVPLRLDRIEDDEERRESAEAAGVTGSLVAIPLERKANVLGVIIIGRSADARPFSEADMSLLATFADQAASTVENASLYEEVRAFNEELEAKVRLRTNELMAINAQLGTTIIELRETQAQLILSERLAGLGQLVAGVAHEINSPSAAIRGTVDALPDTVKRLSERTRDLAELELGEEERRAFLDLAASAAKEAARRTISSPAQVRRLSRELRAKMDAAGIEDAAAAETAHRLAELGLSPELLAALEPLVLSAGAGRARSLVGYLTELVYLHRAADTIDNAIKRIQRIVGGLKSYSHLDQEPSRIEADLHEGIENTIVLFDHLLARGIDLRRRYGKIPKVPVYVDELNQVWTNLIHNAVQALDGRGALAIETEESEGGVLVRVIDDGPGIPGEVLPRIFEPFFTTKKKGEGSGLGLGIVRQIVEKHGGRVQAESEPGRTCFEVWLPAGGTRAEERAPDGGTPG